MPDTEYLPFATDGGANVMSQAAYAALGARGDGFASGPAVSEQFNKVWRQSSVVAAALTQAIVNALAVDVEDDGDVAALTAKIEAMIVAVALADFTAFGISLGEAADAAAARTLLLAASRANSSLSTTIDKGNSGTATQTFVVANGAAQKVTVTGAHTWAFTWAAGYTYQELAIQAVNAGAFAITYPTVTWLRGDGSSGASFGTTGVTLQASGSNWFVFWTNDGGSTVYGRAA